MNQHKHKNIYNIKNGYLVQIGRDAATRFYFGRREYSDPLQAAIMARNLLFKEMGIPVED